ncbi:unnamed protein product [Paramecium sonneborni]|uniref:14-3-3 domain-containing protein n=1 Tax=Paramecium sonneborni TaxID=65129 RepID=A0A8S1N3P3_9CILI|nr:unnamed protein product [Paramecium sonneborni]
MISREELIYMSKVCEQAERYEDMITYIRQIALMEQELSAEERNLFIFPYYYCVGCRKTQMRQLLHIEKREQQKMMTNTQLLVIKKLKSKIVTELNDFCNDFLSIVDNQLSRQDISNETYCVFSRFKYLYMQHKIDYLEDEEEKTMAIKLTKLQYEQTYEKVRKLLKARNLLRLQIGLDFSNFVYEVLNDNKKSCEISNEILMEARNDVNIEEDLGEKKQIESVISLIEENQNLINQQL